MTLYLVKHGSSDYRLHRIDGTELATWSSDPREASDGAIPEMVDGIASAHNGASILGDAQARRDHAKVVTGDWAYRDKAEHGSSEVPW